MSDSDKPLLISFSGGRTSAFMTRVLVDYIKDRETPICFANTGKEREETLWFVNECDKRWNLNVVWLEAVIHPEKGVGTTHRIVDYKTASRNGEPFEAMIEVYGIPNHAFPHCSRELKRRPMDSYCRSLGFTEWERAIRIRADEQHRISSEKNMTYPLVEWAIDKRTIYDWWANQDFQLGLMEHEGNCDFCWKKSGNKLVRLARENPDRLNWWAEMERKYSDLVVPGRSATSEPTYFFRGRRSANDIKELADLSARQGCLFDAFLTDQEEDCFCKA